MNSPAAIVRIAITGSQILGRALLAGGRQAIQNAKQSPNAASDVNGVNGATSGSMTDKLTVEHRMTVDEAHLILNTKHSDKMESILKNYEHLLKQNAPPTTSKSIPSSSQSSTGARASSKSSGASQPAYSHYLQSKVVRARERIEAELKITTEEELTVESSTPKSPQDGSSPNPPLP